MAKRKLLFIVLVFVLILFFSFLRPMNYDEAYYLESSHLLATGILPYSNFHFHMMPLLLLLYAPFSSFGFWSYVILKMVSIAFILLAFLIYRNYLMKEGFDKKKIMFFSVLFFFNSFCLDWALTIKIYSVSIFLFAGYIFYFDKYLSGYYQNKNLYASALFILLLLFLKLSFAGNAAVFLFFSFFVLKRNKTGKIVKQFLTCCLILIIPLILFIFLNRYNYDKLYFDLAESNLIMRRYYYPFDFSKIYLPLLIPQNLILIVIILFSGFKYSLFEKFILFNIFTFIVVHALTSMLPEYYSTIIPSIVLLAFLRLERFSVFVKNRVHFLPASRIIYALSFVYILCIPFGISSLKHIFENKTLVLNTFEMNKLRETINKAPGKTILSSWEGYSIYSDKNPLMAEHYISSFLREFMSKDELKRHNVSTYSDFMELIKEKKPDIIVYDTVNPAHLKGLHQLIENMYSKQAEYKYVIVYKKF